MEPNIWAFPSNIILEKKLFSPQSALSLLVTRYLEPYWQRERLTAGVHTGPKLLAVCNLSHWPEKLAMFNVEIY